MANHHFGEIGDVWKHLPLLSIIGDARHSGYWESHAGSAAYAWDETQARRFGAQRYLQLSAKEPLLDGAAYTTALRESLGQESPVYPGSTRLVLGELVSRDPDFVFCDLDGSSIASIEMEAERAGVRSESLTIAKADGNLVVIKLVDEWPGEALDSVLALIDPFSLETVGVGGVSSLDALQAAASAGVNVVLWWCARTPAERERRMLLIDRAIDGSHAVTQSIIVGDSADTGSVADQFGIWSCAVTLVNIPLPSVTRTAKLGEALARVYSEKSDADAAERLPGLRFESFEHATKGAAL